MTATIDTLRWALRLAVAPVVYAGRLALVVLAALPVWIGRLFEDGGYSALNNGQRQFDVERPRRGFEPWFTP